MNRLKKKYQSEIIAKLAKEFGLTNRLACPKVTRVVVNVGVGEAKNDKTILDSAAAALSAITGQKPKVCLAKSAIAGFNLQKNTPIGLMVTLRGNRMYDFLEKLFNVVLPRTRDFQGVSPKSFDGQGNYTLGAPEMVVFPEVDYEKLTKVKGLEITIVTDSGDDKKSKRLLEEMGMPFTKN